MKLDFSRIQSGEDTNISILLYIERNVRIDYQIGLIQSGRSTDIIINKYFQDSPDYQKLQEKINAQAAKVASLKEVEDNSEGYQIQAVKLDQLHKAENLFRTSALRLAETFLKINTNSERLLEARRLFELGLISEADKILSEADLMSDQEALLAQMDYYQKRRKDILNPE